jgi:hypothetical protein
MEIKGKERDLILEHIYVRKLESIDGRFVVRNKIQASMEAKITYENMTLEEKIKTYEDCVDFKIKAYLFDQFYNKSMFMYFVNNCEKKRQLSIKRYVDYLVRTMDSSRKKYMYKKLRIKYLENDK